MKGHLNVSFSVVGRARGAARLAALACLIGHGVSGCGSDGSASTGRNAAAVRLCDGGVANACALAFKCLSAAERTEKGYGYSSEAVCASELTRIQGCATWTSASPCEYEPDFSPVEVSGCLDQQAALPCEVVKESGAALACDRVCAGSPTAGGDAQDTSGGDTSAPGEPVIVDISVSPKVIALEAGSTVTVTVIVHEVSTNSTVLSGAVTRNDSKLADFALTAPEKYEAVVTASALAMNDVAGVIGKDTSVTFTVKFYTSKGTVVSGEGTVALSCPQTEGVCNGECELMNTRSSCGACARACDGSPDGGDASAGMFLCSSDGRCGDVIEGSQRTSCTDRCAAFEHHGHALQCTAGCGYHQSDFRFGEGRSDGLVHYRYVSSGSFASADVGCDDIPEASRMVGAAKMDFDSMECCCESSE